MNIHLCFHGIGACSTEREPGESRYWIGELLFQRILDHVRERSDVELSFDDGNRSDIEIAAPALAERGLRAAFFPLAGRLGEPGSLGGPDLVELRRQGMSIGSHGWSHVPWRQLTAQARQREFVDARSALEEASGAVIDSAACPLGRYDRGTLQGLSSAGYQAVYTSDRFPARATSWLQARYSITAGDTIDSVLRILRGRMGPGEVRNVLSSAIKRYR